MDKRQSAFPRSPPGSVSQYLLDSDIAIEVMRGRNQRVLERLAACAAEEVSLSAVTVAELFFGAHRTV